jgi:hypothetical protein
VGDSNSRLLCNYYFFVMKTFSSRKFSVYNSCNSKNVFRFIAVYWFWMKRKTFHIGSIKEWRKNCEKLQVRPLRSYTLQFYRLLSKLFFLSLNSNFLQVIGKPIRIRISWFFIKYTRDICAVPLIMPYTYLCTTYSKSFSKVRESLPEA